MRILRREPLPQMVEFGEWKVSVFLFVREEVHREKQFAETKSGSA
jgi:hypothetical protein